MRIVPFKQVDVFADESFRGNPLAVILDAEGLDDVTMQRIAAWTNLSETTFLLPPTRPDTSYRVRIFTPRQELPFAGHPSLGTAHAALESGFVRTGVDRLVQECGAGLLPVQVDGDGAQRRIYVQAPAARIGAADLTLTMALAKALGAPVVQHPGPAAVDVGPVWIVVDLERAETVRRLTPDLGALAAVAREHDATGVAVFGATGENDPALEVRCFVPGEGIPEDPVTGSGNAAIAAWLRAHQILRPGPIAYTARQGMSMGRDGRVHLRIGADERIAVGGRVLTVIDGVIRL